jgi:hypothetical protein
MVVDPCGDGPQFVGGDFALLRRHQAVELEALGIAIGFFTAGVQHIVGDEIDELLPLEIGGRGFHPVLEVDCHGIEGWGGFVFAGLGGHIEIVAAGALLPGELFPVVVFGRALVLLLTAGTEKEQSEKGESERSYHSPSL